jgi:hypothetical protein
MYHKIWDLVEVVSWLIFYGIAPASGTPRKRLWNGSLWRFTYIEAVNIGARNTSCACRCTRWRLVQNAQLVLRAPLHSGSKSAV